MGSEPKHLHYDVRFILEANPNEDKIIVSDESHDVKWIPLEDVTKYNPERSIRRMIAKTIEF